MAAKSRASTSSSALAEILGIADSGSATPVTPSSVPTSYPPTPFEVGPSTSSSDPSGTATPAEEIKLQELTVSSKSVMDYFKEKLAAKSRPSSSPSTHVPAEEADDYDERPRMGLGASRLRQEVSLEVEEHRGLGGIGSAGRMSFASMFTTATVTRPTEVIVGTEAEVAVEDHDVGDLTSKKSQDKKDKERKKEKKSKKEKGKEKEVDGAGDVEESGTAADEKGERKRRKEEKRRRKEAQSQASETDDGDGGDLPSLEDAGHKRKSKKKSKTDR